MASSTPAKTRDDFKPLTEAAKLIHSQLKLDENDVHDLYYQLKENPSNDSHQYFVEPYKNTWSPMLECESFIEMPHAIQEQYKTLQMATYMGIFPEISRVWVTVDNRLYLWDYENPNSVIFPYEALDNVIIAVALCAPRPGLFLDRVKYVLVISTAVEIVILALSWENDDVTDCFRVHQSPYAISTDDVPMISIVSAQNGRIFMGGKDGNLYELVYENHGDSWKAKIGIGEQHKCYKINLSSWHLENLVPSLFKGMLGWEQSVQDVAVDSVRGLVYSLTSLGNLYVMFLGVDGMSSQFLSSHVNIFSGISDRSSHAQRISIVSMHVVSPQEAKGVHLVVILSNGVRLYYTVFDEFHDPFNPTSTHPSRTCTPMHVRLTGSPRHPPNAATLLQQLRSDVAAPSTEGLAPHAGSAMKIQRKSAFYSHGLMLAELQPDPDADISEVRTTLLGFSQDFSRHTHTSGSNSSDRRVSPSLREAATLLPLTHPNPQPSIHGDVHDIKETCPQLHNIELSRLRAKYAVSRTSDHRPLPVKVSTSSSGFGFGLFGSVPSAAHMISSDPPPGPSQCLAFAGRAKGSGIALDDKSSLLQLSELVWQHLPCPSGTQRRQLLVLTSYGLHRVNKVRPVDYLWRILAQSSQVGDMEIAADRFFQAFGCTEACAMCLGIACGLPVDVGDGSAVSQQFEEIKRRAMSILQHFGEALPIRPTAPGTVYRGPVFSPSHDALASFTSRLLRLIWSRSLVSACPSSLLATSMSSAKAAAAAGADMQMVPSHGVFSFRQQRLLFLLNRKDIGCLLLPLILLEGVLLNYFGPAIRLYQQGNGSEGNFGAGKSGKTNGIIRLITQQQDYMQKSPMSDAKAKENESCNGIYLLVSRAIQALKLFQILMKREEENTAVKVRWEILKDKLFSDLVTSASTHDLIRHMLNTLLADLSVAASKADTRASRDRLLLIAEQLANEFSSECNMYFSPGGKYLYEGRKCLANAKGATPGSQELADFLAEAGKHLCKAARYWRTLNEVGDDEGVLGTICDELLSLGGDGPLRVIDICLAAACNFGGQQTGQGMGQGSSNMISSPGVPSIQGKLGDENVYHTAGITGSDNLLKAKHRCYDRIISCLRRVKIGPNLLGAGEVTVPVAELHTQGQDNSRDVVKDMIAYALQQTGDFDFHRQLYEYLLESDKEQLIYVQSRHIEDFLRESDTTLLFRHYKYHSFFSEAAYLMDLQAHSGETSPLSVYSLAKRIEYLEKAVVCTDQAIRTRGSGGQNSNVVIKYNREKLLSLRDELDLANVQLSIFNALDAEYSAVKDLTASVEGKRKLDLMKRKIDELGSSLVSSSSELYNITHSYHLWNYSLMLLHICKHEDTLLIENLWKSIIYRLIPKNNSEVDRYLKDTFGGCFRDKRRERTDISFDDYRTWIPHLREEVIDLSQKLGDGGDSRMFFPVLKLVEYLEQVTAEVSFAQGEDVGGAGGGRDVIGRSWVHRCLGDDVGVPLSELLEAYMTIIRHQVTGKQDKTKLQLYHSASAIMLEWVRLASTNSRRHHDDVQSFFLHRVKYRQWLEELQRLLKQSMDAKNVEGKSIYREAQKSLNQAEELMKALLLR